MVGRGDPDGDAVSVPHRTVGVLVHLDRRRCVQVGVMSYAVPDTPPVSAGEFGMGTDRLPVLAWTFLPRKIAVAWCEAEHNRNRLEVLMRIADVLRNKGAAVVTINPDATVHELLAGLAEQNIGAMVVMGAEGIVGIVSERDVVRQLHTHGASVLSRPVSKIMTTGLATCAKSDTVDSISVLMTKNRVRHVPVLDGTKLIGIVSIGDLVKTRMEELEAQQQQLHSYITQG